MRSSLIGWLVAHATTIITQVHVDQVLDQWLIIDCWIIYFLFVCFLALALAFDHQRRSFVYCIRLLLSRSHCAVVVAIDCCSAYW
jgi:hypothetical protein